MGWSELRAIPNAYNEEVQALDEQIIALSVKRRQLSQGVRLYPAGETIEAWAKQYELEPMQIQHLLHQLQDQNHMRRVVEEGPGELRNVLPILKQSVVEECQYKLTHAMQHEHASILHVEIQYLDRTRHDLHLIPHLMLEIISDSQRFTINRHGSRGGGLQTEMQFLVSPPIPDSLDGVEFSLIPSKEDFGFRIEEKILDQQVDF